MEQEYYTPDEVAEKLRVSVSAVYKWISERKLKAARFGKARRISRAALEEFIRKAEAEEPEEGKK
jgi:excisionase family DNA binding protein